MSPLIYIVGNAEVAADRAAAIDAAELVVRFNLCPNLGRQTGRRTSHLWLTNTGKPGQGFTDPSRLQAVLSRSRPERIVLARPALNPVARLVARVRADHSAMEYGRLICERARSLGVPCHYARPRLQADVMRVLLGHGQPAVTPKCPSTGILAIHHYATAPEYSRHAIAVAGFGFQGWKFHPWELERAYVDDLARRGRLVIADRA